MSALIPLNPWVDTQYQKVAKLVTEAIDAGQTFCTLGEEESLLEETCKQLRKQGYHICSDVMHTYQYIEFYPGASMKA